MDENTKWNLHYWDKLFSEIKEVQAEIDKIIKQEERQKRTKKALHKRKNRNQ